MTKTYRWAAALAALAVTRSALAADIDVLASNIYSGYFTTLPADDVVEADLAAIQADGSFSTVDYANTSTVNWQSTKHLNKLNGILVAYSTPGSAYYHSASVKTAAYNVYNYWLTKDPQNANWYFNQIAVPDKLAQAMLVMQQQGILPATNYAKAVTIVDRALKGQGGASQGANLTAQAKITVVEGVVRYRATGATTTEKTAASNLINSSYNYIGSTLNTVTDLAVDGIRVDKSFQQHEQTLADAGYGLGLLTNVSITSGWGAGTHYGLSTTAVHNMIDYMLDGGPQWMVRGTTFDPLANGRGWSRPGTTDSASALLPSVTTAIALSGGYRASELTTMQTRLSNAKTTQAASPTEGPSGNRNYWVSDYMVQQRPGYMLSLKTVSTRTNTPEMINEENLKAGYGCAGVNMLFRTGHEYDNIYAVWDWYRLPGTTSERSSTGSGGTYSILPDHHFGKTEMVGGASNGQVGGHIYQMNEYGVTANKGYFFFDKGEVAMGNSIKQTTANTAGGLIGTNINQTLLNGTAFYSNAAGSVTTLTAGKTVSPANLRWVNHDSVGYFFLTPVSNATIRTIEQTGNWDSINTSGTISTVRANVFSLDLNHGSLPTGASYLYAIIPNITPNLMDAYLAGNPFTVLRNDSFAQGVTDNSSGISEITFFDQGSVTLADGTKISQTNRYHGTSVIWDPDGTTVDFSFANVDGYTGGNFSYTVNRQLSGVGAVWNAGAGLTTLTFSPMTGTSAGSTFTRTFTFVGGAPNTPEPAMLGLFLAAACLCGRPCRVSAHRGRAPESAR
jgi:chondroitin AC lyase